MCWHHHCCSLWSVRPKFGQNWKVLILSDACWLVTVVIMLPLKLLAFLILCVSLVGGNYLWMETKAFSGNSDSQEKRAASGGYGEGGYHHSVGVNYDYKNHRSRPTTSPRNINRPTSDLFQDYTGKDILLCISQTTSILFSCCLSHWFHLHV